MTLKTIAETVADFHGVTLAEMRRHKGKGEDLQNAKRRYHYFAKMHTGKPYTEIGAFLKRDHATALYHTKTTLSHMVTYSEEREEIRAIERIIESLEEQSDHLGIVHEILTRNEPLNWEIGRAKRLLDEYFEAHGKKRLCDAG